TEDDEREAYAALEPLQRKDFVGIFEAMDGLPVTVRLLDPPLHEFLPNQVDLAVAVAVAQERGDAEVVVRDEKLPLEEARETRRGIDVAIQWGTMIELPRAAMVAGDIAEVSDFFSFGTNDLTQTAFGFSRDDIGKFLGMYEERKLLPANPFVTIDRPGTGRLMSIACQEGRASNPELHLGICGEHGGDPASVQFCHEIGLDYVACSPFRVQTARLAAGQAVVGEASQAAK